LLSWDSGSENITNPVIFCSDILPQALASRFLARVRLWLRAPAKEQQAAVRCTLLTSGTLAGAGYFGMREANA
jgi:hypothetical protein